MPIRRLSAHTSMQLFFRFNEDGGKTGSRIIKVTIRVAPYFALFYPALPFLRLTLVLSTLSLFHPPLPRFPTFLPLSRSRLFHHKIMIIVIRKLLNNIDFVRCL